MNDRHEYLFARERLCRRLLALTLACGLLGCSPTPVGQAARQRDRRGTPTVYVVNYPLAYFAERIGQSNIQVVFPVPAGEDPAFWMPPPEIIAAYQSADLILLNGASYAKWIDKVSLPSTKLVDTSASFRDQLITIDDAFDHAHGPTGEHTHAGTASTTWLDPALAVAQARTILTELVALRPLHKNSFQRNFAVLERELLGLDARFKSAVRDTSVRPVIFSHPVYEYFVRRYDLVARSVHWEPDEVPPEALWADLRDLLEQLPARWMIWEGRPLAENVERLRELGIESITFDPCGNVPQEGDYLSVMRQNAENLARVFSSGND